MKRWKTKTLKQNTGKYKFETIIHASESAQIYLWTKKRRMSLLVTLLTLPTPTILPVWSACSAFSHYIWPSSLLSGDETCTLQGLLVTKPGKSPVILSQTIKLKCKSNGVAPAHVTWSLWKHGLLKVIRPRRPRRRRALVCVSGIFDSTSPRSSPWFTF